jgi:hypothetical protein
VPASDAIYDWDSLPAIKNDKSLVDVKEEIDDFAGMDVDSDEEKELANAQPATLSQLQKAEATTGEISSHQQKTENFKLTLEYDTHRQAWHEVLRTLNSKLHRLQKVTKDSQLFSALPLSQQLVCLS